MSWLGSKVQAAVEQKSGVGRLESVFEIPKFKEADIEPSLQKNGRLEILLSSSQNDSS